MTPEMRSLTHAVEVVCAVRERLEWAGAVIELDHLRRMSPPELDLLVRMELEDAA